MEEQETYKQFCDRMDRMKEDAEWKRRVRDAEYTDLSEEEIHEVDASAAHLKEVTEDHDACEQAHQEKLKRMNELITLMKQNSDFTIQEESLKYFAKSVLEDAHEAPAVSIACLLDVIYEDHCFLQLIPSFVSYLKSHRDTCTREGSLEFFKDHMNLPCDESIPYILDVINEDRDMLLPKFVRYIMDERIFTPRQRQQLRLLLKRRLGGLSRDVSGVQRRGILECILQSTNKGRLAVHRYGLKCKVRL